MSGETGETPKTPYIILGCGYTGTRLAHALRRDGIPVRACARRVALLEPLRQIGVDVHYLDASKPRSFMPVLRGYKNPVVVYSIPGVPTLPVGEAVRRAADAALTVQASAFIYLGTTGVHGRNETGDPEEWVDETSSVDINDPDMTSRLADEAAVSAVGQAGLRVVTLRLAAIYGPPNYNGQAGRGVRMRMRKGEYRLWDGGKHYFSRIHVDDLVQVIRAAAEHAPASSLYDVGDDHPCTQAEYGRWLAAHLGLPEPLSLDSLRPEAPRQIIRGRRIRNQKMKEQLGLSLKYPSYREGEAQIDEEEGQRGKSPEPPAESPAVSPEPTPVVSPPKEPEPEALAVPPPAPEPAVSPRWPLPLRIGEPLADKLNLAHLHAQSLRLLPGHDAAQGAYLVLFGSPLCSLDGQMYSLAPFDLVPARAKLHNPEDALPALLLRFDEDQRSRL